MRKKNAIPYLSKEPFPIPEVYQSQLPPGLSLRDALRPQLGDIPDIVGLVSQQVIFGTYPIDLTNDTANAVIELPANTLLLPDAIDVVIVESDGAGGTPEIQVGPNDAEPDSYLATTAINTTAIGGRETFEPLTRDGMTSLRVSVVIAGTGTLSAKVVVRGYVMEI
ncbi:hypothetical protein QEN58_09660 [Halomonas alkaliantarctica]|uniref:Uncharacterized protein n=1 Tax=Halomonas alkaliantarctica TaxID=232346 RepID=A0ABY8LGM5_9GAMM|nr:hypothetical protein [Halomonas alkaliantarctica]WGI23623.1 hypothetical protein QEN58_09660 [Halomonas alkaliantarctica]